MPSLLGPVVTNVKNVDSLIRYLRLGQFSAVKVVSGWGLSTGAWTNEDRAALLGACPRVIVRTLSGDPSYQGEGGDWLPRPEKVLEEIAPWVTLRKDLWVELGNEPDVVGFHNTDLIWEYCWYAKEAVKAIKLTFPKVRIISPAVRLGEQGWQQWMEKLHSTTYFCDTVGLHVYGAERIVRDPLDQLARGLWWAGKYFPKKTIAITELGVHNGMPDPMHKLELYRKFARSAPTMVTWSMFYHLVEDCAIQGEYNIPEGVVSR